MASWTKQEDRIVCDMWAAGEKLSVIAATLGRKDDQVRWRREVLGLPSRVVFTGNAFTKDEDNALIRLWGMGFSCKEIAEALDRTEPSINSRARRLRKLYPGRVSLRFARTPGKRESDMEFVTSVAEIQRVVARAFQVPCRIINSPSRLQGATRPRFVAMALARKLTRASLPALARAFNRKDHTTVLNGIRQAHAKWPDRIAELEAQIVGMKEAAE